MYRFVNSQEVYEISGVKFGGQPGDRRAVMIGSLFYPGHSIVEDRRRGRVNAKAFESLMERYEKTIDDTSTPSAVMIYAETAEAFRSYFQLLADRIPSPIFLDSPHQETRLDGARIAAEMGLAGRIIYNSIHAGTSSEELRKLSETGIDSAVVLAFDPAAFDLKGKIYLLENGGGILDEGLLEMVRRQGISRPLLDTAVMAMDQGAGSALRAIVVAKAKWGLPCGCAPHNAVESWKPFKETGRKERFLYANVDSASCAITIMAGADFVMYGPLEACQRIFYTASFTDQLMSQAAAEC